MAAVKNGKPELYQFAVVWHPSEKQVENGERSKLIVEPKIILAADESAATIMAAREIPQEFLNQLDQVQVAIRRF